MDDPARRPLASRETTWARSIAARIARSGISPNTISAVSMVFAAGAGAALGATRWIDSVGGDAVLLVGAAVAIQGRLLCNLFDGMVAVEGGKKSATGDLWNDAPDRVADVVILIGAGYALPAIPGGVELGWAAALLAVMTAYIRWLGRATGGGMHYCGPMAKQQRMAVVTIACIAAAVVSPWDWQQHVIAGALGLVVLGSIVTCLRRLGRTVGELKAKT